MPIFGCLINQTKAYSEEVTGLSLTSFNKNQGNFAFVGNYYIFSTDKKILFYDLTGNVAKVWNIPDTNTYQRTYIKSFDSSSVMVVTVSAPSSGYGGLSCFMYIVNVNTLVYSSTLIFSNLFTSGYTYAFLFSMTLIYNNNNYYVLVSGMQTDYGPSSVYKEALYEIYPTVSNLGILSTGTANVTFDTTIYINSSTTNIVYLLSNSYSGDRVKIFKLNLVTPSLTTIGTGATDSDWYNYVYLIGYDIDTVSSDTYYDVAVSYPYNPTIAKELFVAIIRFNDTFVDVNRRITIQSPDSPINEIRILTCLMPDGMVNWDNLIDGTYYIVFVGENYYMKQFDVILGGLGTNTPTLTSTGSLGSYENGRLYYTSSNNVGGLQPMGFGGLGENIGWEWMIQLDYQNGRAILDAYPLSTSEFPVFAFYLEPTPISYTGLYDFSIYDLTTYTYTGQLIVTGLTGTFTVNMTSLSVNPNIATTGTYTTYTSGDMVAGAGGVSTDAVFQLPYQTNNAGNYYQGIMMIFNVTEPYVYNVAYTQTITWVYNTGASPAPSSPPYGVNTDLVVNFMMMFILIFVPPLILSFEFSKHGVNPLMGFMGGLILTTGIGYETGYIALWFLFLIALLEVILTLELLHGRGAF